MFEIYLRQEIRPVLRLVEDIARENLIDYDIDASGDLIDSVTCSLGENMELLLEFAPYGLIQDRGLRGSRGGRDSNFTAIPRYRSGLTDDVFGDRTASNILNERRPGQIFIRIRDLEEWIGHRGINIRFGQTRNSTAFALARSIRERGYDGRPWLRDTINDERIDEAMADAVDRATQRELDDMANNITNANR